MSIFQKSIINKYLKNLDNKKVELAFKQFQTFYGDKLRLSDIIHLKEENYQEGFLREIFVQSLGYTIRPDLNYNLTTEYKNQTDSKKADGAIIKNNSAIGVIELKSTKTFNLDSIKNQAFNYKHNQPDCRYVITSNFHHLRFYIDNSTEYEEFDLFELTEQQFKFFYLILSQDSVFNDIPLKMKEETKFHEKSISDIFYKDYKAFKDQIFENLVKNNPQYDKITLFKKSQKLLDRFLFVYFSEDCGLCPPNSIQQIIDQWKRLQDDDIKCSLYSRFQKMFEYLDKGHKGKHFEFPGFNGGLFKHDELLDDENTNIDDDILLKHCPKLSAYDFNTDIDVNILGHIFEHSLNEIEEITAELSGESFDKSKTKKKKDGVFYTPKYITNYIVENTIGKLCKDKQTELQISEIEINETFNKKGKITKQGKELYTKLQGYKNWLLSLKILDPSCGSGAFLNSALDFLMKEHQEIDDLISDLTGDKIRMFDTDKNILENNIFGVDINEESVEIAKLSLWLRTAKKDRKLSDLNNNIKCGNSLIDNKEIAGEKAFDWKTEFSEIMKNCGFDVVIGNPPFVLSRDNKLEEYKNYFHSNFRLSQEKVNLYLIFMEKTYHLLKNEGLFGFVVPNSWLGMESAENIREFYLKNVTINKIVNLKGESFQGVNVETTIFTYSKKITDNSIVNYTTIETPEINEFEFKQIEQSKWLNNRSFIFDVLSNSEQINVINKILKNSFLVSDYYDVKVGLQAYEKGKGNPKQSEEDVKNHIFDYTYKFDDCTFKYLNGGDIQRYSFNWSGQWLRYGNWLSQPKDFSQFSSERILIREITSVFPKVLNATFVSDTFLNNKSIINILSKNTEYSLKYLLAILNSSTISFFHIRRAVKGNRTLFPKLVINDAKNYPIKTISKELQNPFIHKVDEIISINEKILGLNEKFSKRLKSNFSNIAFTTKLLNFSDFDFNSVIVELKKQKIELNLKQQDEWEEYFESYKKEIKALQYQRNQIDKEIDKMIYKLYNLTTEEIAIVEGKN